MTCQNRYFLTRFQPQLDRLEERLTPSVSTLLTGSTLVITGLDQSDRIDLRLSDDQSQLIVQDAGTEIDSFNVSSISLIQVNTLAGNDRIRIDDDVLIPIEVDAGDDNNLVIAGGGPTTIIGGANRDKLIARLGPAVMLGNAGNDLLKSGASPNLLDGGLGRDALLEVKPADLIAVDAEDVIRDATLPLGNLTALTGLPDDPTERSQVLSAVEVQQLLDRASAVSASTDAIICIVDRNGRILGVRVEDGVASTIQNDPFLLTFAVDGAVSLARTAAFFANNQAPLTSRTIRNLSQTTITQRQVESNPNITDRNSTDYGPGFVAPVGVGAHFPPGIALTPQVDLFAIEHTNRDSILKDDGTGNKVLLPGRFNINPAFVPAGKELFPPESYGFVSGLLPNAQSRGIATLPGGIPLYKNGILVGGIGVFFPGTTGTATEMNSSLSTTFDPSRLDRSLEAEFIAFMAAGGAPQLGFPASVFDGLPPLPGIALPLTPELQRIDLVGITLDVVGPGGIQGPENLVKFAQTFLRPGSVNGRDLPVTTAGQQYLDGLPVPSGWLVMPHDGVGITADQVALMIQNGINQALETRAAIRLPLNSSTRMVFAVTDTTGEVLGLFRMPDATIFSIDVAVAKARNTAYYADARVLQPIDQVEGVPPGVAFSNRTFRYLSGPRFPVGIDGTRAGPFSILNDGGANVLLGTQEGPRLPGTAFQSVQGYDAFNPGTNFRDPDHPLNQNGIIFFPGSSPIYASPGGVFQLVGGLGVSGDGVDQDDVVTAAATAGFGPGGIIMRADEVFVRGVRLPFQKFNRNPRING